MNRKGFALIGLLAVAAIFAIAVVFFSQRRATPVATPTATDLPTQPRVIPTATPDQTEGWKTFEDPFGRYSVKYPPDWFVRPAEEELPGKPSYISTFDLTPLFEGPPGQIVVPEGEFMVVVGLESQEVVEEDDLLGWTRKRSEQVVDLVEIGRIAVNDKLAGVSSTANLPNGDVATSYYFATEMGVLQLRGQPMESQGAEVLDLLVTTLEISE